MKKLLFLTLALVAANAFANDYQSIAMLAEDNENTLPSSGSSKCHGGKSDMFKDMYPELWKKECGNNN